MVVYIPGLAGWMPQIDAWVNCNKVVCDPNQQCHGIIYTFRCLSTLVKLMEYFCDTGMIVQQ